jgi:hypothetical protein
MPSSFKAGGKFLTRRWRAITPAKVAKAHPSA